MKVPIRNLRPIFSRFEGAKIQKTTRKSSSLLCFSLSPYNDFQLVAVLCPNLIHYQILQMPDLHPLLRRERDSNPRYSCPYTAFRVRPDRPLRHLSLKIVPRNHRFGTANIDIFFISAHFRTEKIASERKKSSGRGRLPSPGCFRFRNNSYLCPERTACREQYFAAGSVY